MLEKRSQHATRGRSGEKKAAAEGTTNALVVSERSKLRLPMVILFHERKRDRSRKGEVW